MLIVHIGEEGTAVGFQLCIGGIDGFGWGGSSVVRSRVGDGEIRDSEVDLEGPSNRRSTAGGELKTENKSHFAWKINNSSL